MLVSFKVKNYRSFKEETELSMKASSLKGKDENLIEAPSKTNLLKSAVIYGANASGKSNLIKALVAAIMIIRTSSSRQIDSPIPFVEPFAFSQAKNKNCSFEFEFFQNKKCYIYGFSCNKKRVTEEYLTLYSSQRPTKIFLRTNEKYDFYNTETEKKLKPLIERNTANKLFLSTAATWNAEALKDAYLWFSRAIDVYNSDGPGHESFLMYESDENGDLKRFTTKLLKEADINISDYTFESRKVEISQNDIKEYKILSKHEARDEEGRMQTYELQLSNESKGTQNLFFLSPQIKKALDNGYVFCVDELDSSMHPDLLRYLISLFNSKVTNPNGAQLITTLHSTEVMSLNIFRRDQIYFVNKDNESAESELYSLSEYPVRLNEDVRKAYLSGRFGAVPDIL